MSKAKDYIYDNVTVNRIIDGDTLQLTIQVDAGFEVAVTLSQRFRIKNLDTPETWHPSNNAELLHGQQAKAYAEQLLSTGIRQLQSFKGDEYGRYLGTIILSDGSDFANRMKEAGFQKKKSYQ